MTGQSLIATMASRYQMDPLQFARTVRSTVMPSRHTDEQFAAFMMVAHQYGLNPITREIFAYPGRQGGITPVVSIDGWINLVNSHPACDGFEIAYSNNEDKDGVPLSCTCTIWRSDRNHPIRITEYLQEVYRNTDPWNTMPRRMLRHKAFKECARLAFGFAGLHDEDEARDLQQIELIPNSDEAVKNQFDQFAADAESMVDDDAPEGVTAGPSADSDQTAAARTTAAVDRQQGNPDDIRPDIISTLFLIATAKEPVEDRMHGLEQVMGDLLEQHPVLERFTKEVAKTAAKVAHGELSPIAGRKYVEGL